MDKEKIMQKLFLYISNIQRYTGDCNSLVEFEADPMRVDATVFNLMQIGEVARAVLASEEEIMPDIPWQQIRGLRNRIVHNYDGIDMAIVYETAKEDIPELAEKLKQM